MNDSSAVDTRPVVATLFSRFGPYHLARLKGSEEVIAQAGGRAVAISVAGTDRVYAWDPVEAIPIQNSETLFSDMQYEEIDAPRLIERLNVVLDRLNPVVLALPGWSFAEAMAGLAWCRKNRRAAVLMSESAQGDHFRLWPREIAKQFLVRQFRAALVGGARHAAYARLLGIPRSCIFMGYDAVDNAYFDRGAERVRANAAMERAAANLPNRYILSSSRFVAKKNLDGLLRGYARYCARFPEAPDLVLCGDGPLRPRLETLIRDLKIEARVHLPGFVQYPDLPRYYALAEAFILASTTEQWGLVVNEAAASSLPLLISNRCGSAPELVREGENGYTFDPYAVDAIATALAKLPSDAATRARFGQRSLELVRMHSPEAFGKGLLEASRMALARMGREDLGPPGGAV